MRGIPRDRPQALATQESLPQEQFLARAVQQNTGATRAATTETFLRNEWGTRTFGYHLAESSIRRMAAQPAVTDAGSRARAGRKTARSATTDSIRSTISRSTTAASAAASATA